VGSDEEKALVKAIRDSFLSAGNVFHSLHIKDNLRHHMTKIGWHKKNATKVISLVFGNVGLTSAADKTTFEYLQERIIPKLLNNFTVISGNENIAKHAWNNNNCESVNNLLKLSIDWKPAKVMDLVDHIHNIVKLQYSDLHRSLFGQGNYQLAAAFSHHYTPYAHWARMSEEASDKVFTSFMEDTGNVYAFCNILHKVCKQCNRCFC